MASRIFVIMIGTWLIVSAFAWPHTRAETVNIVVIGALAMTFAVRSMSRAWALYANVTLAAWLFLSTFRFPVASQVTLMHNALMALAIFVGSVISGGPHRHRDLRHPRELYGRT